MHIFGVSKKRKKEEISLKEEISHPCKLQYKTVFRNKLSFENKLNSFQTFRLQFQTRQKWSNKPSNWYNYNNTCKKNKLLYNTYQLISPEVNNNRQTRDILSKQNSFFFLIKNTANSCLVMGGMRFQIVIVSGDIDTFLGEFITYFVMFSLRFRNCKKSLSPGLMMMCV